MQKEASLRVEYFAGSCYPSVFRIVPIRLYFIAFSYALGLLYLLAVAIDALITAEKATLDTFVFVSAFNYCVRQHVSAVKEEGYIAQGKQ